MKRWAHSLLLSIIGFLFATFAVGAALNAIYGDADIAQLPLLVWLLLGPILGLMTGHGLVFYLLGFVVIVSATTIAARVSGKPRVATLGAGLVVWILIGAAMY
jgi:hypothetical protein